MNFYQTFVFEKLAKRVPSISLKNTSFLTTRPPNHGLKRTEINKKIAVAKRPPTVNFFLWTVVLENFQVSRKNFKNFVFFFTYKSPIAFIGLDRFRRNLVWIFVYVPVCIPDIFVVLAQSIRLNLCLRKFVKFPKKVQKNGNPKGLLASLHGVFRGVYLFEMRTLCAPNISGQIL